MPKNDFESSSAFYRRVTFHQIFLILYVKERGMSCAGTWVITVK